MKLSPNEIKEYQKLISELEKSGWETVGAYWVNYAQANVPPEKQGKLNITAVGFQYENARCLQSVACECH